MKERFETSSEASQESVDSSRISKMRSWFNARFNTAMHRGMIAMAFASSVYSLSIHRKAHDDANAASKEAIVSRNMHHTIDQYSRPASPLEEADANPVPMTKQDAMAIIEGDTRYDDWDRTVWNFDSEGNFMGEAGVKYKPLITKYGPAVEVDGELRILVNAPDFVNMVICDAPFLRDEVPGNDYAQSADVAGGNADADVDADETIVASR